MLLLLPLPSAPGHWLSQCSLQYVSMTRKSPSAGVFFLPLLNVFDVFLLDSSILAGKSSECVFEKIHLRKDLASHRISK